jgi:hypothetical protein
MLTVFILLQQHRSRALLFILLQLAKLVRGFILLLAPVPQAPTTAVVGQGQDQDQDQELFSQRIQIQTMTSLNTALRIARKVVQKADPRIDPSKQIHRLESKKCPLEFTTQGIVCGPLVPGEKLVIC